MKLSQMSAAVSKYAPLETFLRGQTASECPLTFVEIERILGVPLPPAAHAHRAWWSNNPSNNVMTKSWLAAGYVSERVDMTSQKVVFRRDRNPAPGPDGVAEQPARRLSPSILDAVRARLSGTVTVPEGVDITAPTGEVWDAER